MKSKKLTERYIAEFTIFILLRLLEAWMWNKPCFRNLLQRQTCQVFQLEEKNLEIDDIEPCEVFELEGKDTVFFSNPKEGPNSDQNLDAPEFDDDEAPSNSKKDTYVKIFKTTIIVFDIIIWTKIIWRLVRGR